MRLRNVLLLALALFTTQSPAAETLITNLADLVAVNGDTVYLGRRFSVTGRLIAYYRRPLTHEWIFTIADDRDLAQIYELNAPGLSARNLAQPHLNDLVRLSGTFYEYKGLAYPGYTDAQLIAPASANDPILSCDKPSELFRRGRPNQLLRITGTIRDFFRDESDANFIHMSMDCSGEILHALVFQPTDTPAPPTRYVGSIVTVTGMGRSSDSTMRRYVGHILLVSGLENIVLATRDSPIRLKNIDDVALTTPLSSPSAELYQAEGDVLCVWNPNQALIRTRGGNIAKVRFIGDHLPDFGQSIRVKGILETDLYFLNLVNASWEKLGPAKLPYKSATDIPLRELFLNEFGDPTLRVETHGQTIRLSGIIRHLPRASDANTRFHIASDGYLVPIDVGRHDNLLQTLEIGSIVSITGTCVVDIDSYGIGTSVPRARGLFLVLRTPDDLVILSRPSWWTPFRLLCVIGALLLVLVGILVWNVTLKRLAERRGRELADEQLKSVTSELKVYERTHLAVELHDSLSQTLSGVSMQIDAVGRFADTDRDRMRKHLSIASKTLKSCRDELRNCLTDLRSSALEEQDLNEAIRQTLEPYSDDAAISIRFFIPREILSDNTAHTILRIIRELVVNAIRHGHANKVKVAGALENGKLLFSVTDNGCGFDTESAPGLAEGHFGLQGIRERVDGLDGNFEIESKAGQGSKATVSIVLPSPLNEEKT